MTFAPVYSTLMIFPRKFPVLGKDFPFFSTGKYRNLGLISGLQYLGSHPSPVTTTTTTTTTTYRNLRSRAIKD
jgi:hypothetical protein